MTDTYTNTFLLQVHHPVRPVGPRTWRVARVPGRCQAEAGLWHRDKRRDSSLRTRVLLGTCMESASCSQYTQPQSIKHAVLQGHMGGWRGVHSTITNNFPRVYLFHDRTGICVHFFTEMAAAFSQFRQITKRGDVMFWTKHTVQALSFLWTVSEIQKNAIFRWVRWRERNHDCHVTRWDFKKTLISKYKSEASFLYIHVVTYTFTWSLDLQYRSYIILLFCPWSTNILD